MIVRPRATKNLNERKKTMRKFVFAMMFVMWGMVGGCMAGEEPVIGPDGAAPVTACADGVDNDGDGKIDLGDPGCTNSQDNDEADVPLTDGGMPDAPPAATGCRGGGGFLYERTWRQVATIEKWDEQGNRLATIGVDNYTRAGVDPDRPWLGQIRYYAGGAGACAGTANTAAGQNVHWDVVTGIWDHVTDHEVQRWYRTGCTWLPFHNTREEGWTWDGLCWEQTWVVTPPFTIPQ